MKRALIGLALSILLTSLLTSCGSFVASSQPAAPSGSIPVTPGHALGQSFRSTHDGLTGVDVFLSPDSAAPSTDGHFVLRLRDSAEAAADLITATLPARNVTAPGFYRFSFAPIAGSAQRDYFLALEPSGDARLAAGTNAGDAYLDGSLYVDGAPGDAQLAFRAVHDPARMAAGLLGEALGWLALAGIAGAFFLLPGLALIALLWPRRWIASGLDKLGLSIGLGLSVYALLMLWLRIAGASLGAVLAWAVLALSAAVIAWRVRPWRMGAVRPRIRAWLRSDQVWSDAALAGVSILVFSARFYSVRTLAAPMWGDSVHHALITQLIVDNGGLFDSWQPYAELPTLTYHFGFHAAAAIMQWAARLSAPDAVLWVGQALNGLAVIALYPLATQLTGSRWAGVAAVLLAGLWLPMPMFYTNWGRYSQLAGQAILPAAMWLAWRLVSDAPNALPRPALSEAEGAAVSGNRTGIALAVITLSGLVLTHYRVAIFAALWVAVLLAGNLVLRPASFRWARLLAAGAIALIVAAPWLVHTFSGGIPQGVIRQLSTPAFAVPESVQGYNAAGDLADYLPAAIWLLAPACLAWGLVRRNAGFGALAAWSALAVAAANPAWFGLPGTGALSNFAVLIAAYIPASVITGGGLGWLAERFQRRVPQPLIAAAFVVAGGLGAPQRIADIQPGRHQLFTHADARAAAWIREHTSRDARFLVNSFFAYGGEVIAGSDGGWWLPLMAERQTTLPPIRYGNEAEPWPGYVAWVNELARVIQDEGVTHPDALAMLRARGVTHVYIGQRQGRVNDDGSHALDPALLLADARFRPIYHQDRVWIFEVKP